MRAFLIDPFSRTVRAVDAKTIGSPQELIGIEAIEADVIPFEDKRHSVLVNASSTAREGFFINDDLGEFHRGKALLFAFADGVAVDSFLAESEVLDMITFDAQDIDPVYFP